MKTRITTILMVTLLSTSGAWAWDGDGHMQVAEIAWQHLTAASRVRASALLMLNPNYHSWIANVPTPKRNEVAFVMAATWPDFIKTAAGYINDTRYGAAGSCFLAKYRLHRSFAAPLLAFYRHAVFDRRHRVNAAGGP